MSIKTRASPCKGSLTWIAGFFLLGLLLGMLGSLVITWQYHIDLTPRMIGMHFLGLSVGFVTAARLVPLLYFRFALRTIAIASTALSFLALIGLTLLAPPTAPGWRIVMLILAGIAAGGLAPSLFYANKQRFASSPASAANQAGALFFGGALLATLLAGIGYSGISMRMQTVLMALVPLFYLPILWRNRFADTIRVERHQPEPARDLVKDLRSIAALLFSLLIFFQFASEWAIAGWMPLFLIHTLGMSPATAIWALGLYFLALMTGRFLAQALLPIVSHRKMLLISGVLAMAGYLLLSVASVSLTALLAALILGIGHAPIYPLVAERLDDRLSYRPRLYSGTLSLAIAGATATPWLLSYVAEAYGMPTVMLVPAAASVAVLILVVLIMLESHLMGGKHDDASQVLLASDH